MYEQQYELRPGIIEDTAKIVLHVTSHADATISISQSLTRVSEVYNMHFIEYAVLYKRLISYLVLENGKF